LAGYSFLILFFELALIRYISAYVRVFGFFVNFVLIATFLGMGVGLLREGRRRRASGDSGAAIPFWLAPAALLALFGTVKWFSVLGIHVPLDDNEALWAIIPPSAREIGIVPAVLVLFTLVAVLFIPLGAAMGREFRRFPALAAYSYDIAGSLVGVLAFGALSALDTPPLVWLAIGCAGWVGLTWWTDARRAARWTLVPAAAGVLGFVVWTAQPGPDGREIWSPYYRITTEVINPILTQVNVNGMLHQYMIDINRDTVIARLYGEPYATVPRIDTALVIGAGTGNDVALLLKRGAHYIDAVEIDPEIYALGRARHPLHPYSDPRVHIHINDARAFLRHTTRRYDVIAMGTLDSQTLLSGMSSVRLDNYVYTVESMESVRDHLKPDGSLVAYHMSPNFGIAAKVYQITAEAFHQMPRGVVKFRWLFNLTVAAGAAARGMRIEDVQPGLLQDEELPHDDWPYLYLAKRGLAAHYIVALAGVLAIAGLLIFGGAAGKELPRDGASGRGPIGARDLALFSTGLGFLLLESKSVTEMSLLFGSTWTVNLLVFASILTVIGVANALAGRLSTRTLPGTLSALFASIGIAYFVPISALLGLSPVAQWLAGGMIVAVPVFFAALIFAVLFRDHPDPTRGLAVNLMGAILGGVLEYTAMATGVKALYLVAAAGYLVTVVAVRRLQASRVREPLDAAFRRTPVALQA
jgi:SAM-dependent methyltransferase